MKVPKLFHGHEEIGLGLELVERAFELNPIGALTRHESVEIDNHRRKGGGLSESQCRSLLTALVSFLRSDIGTPTAR